MSERETGLNGHPVTEHGTTRCPNEGWVAAQIDDEDGCCWACGELVISPAQPTPTPTDTSGGGVVR